MSPTPPPSPVTGPVLLTELDHDPAARPRVVVKDCVDVAGVVTTVGCPAVADGAEPATADAACLAGTRATGAAIVGKANLHELCFGSTGINPHYGTPPNPYDASRIPGGSSSGPAVAVATGLADVAIGTDTTGSVRNPAACCGVAGLKTTRGRVPLAGVRPLAPSMDTVGALGATVAAVAEGWALLDRTSPAPDATGSAAAGAGDPEDDLVPAATVGRLYLAGTEPTIDAAIDSALAECGMVPVEMAVPGWEIAHDAALDLLFGEALVANAEVWPAQRDRLGDDVAARFRRAEQIGPQTLTAARDRIEAWRAELARVFAEVDVLALPGMLAFPPRIGDHDIAPNPAAAGVSLAGNPAIVLPLPSGGLFPASLQLVGPDDAEARLLATAAVIESAIAE